MKILDIIIILVVIIPIGVVSTFLFVLSQYKDEIWEEIKRRLK